MEIKNRSVFHEFAIEDRLTAGMVLKGTEVKSIRDGKVSFTDTYCFFHVGEHDRKLLLTKKELRKWEQKTKDKGYTIVPLRIFFNENNIAKIEIGLAKGKKLHDKRATIKQKDVERELRRYKL
jgi:SsrA-binding protein